MGYSRTLPADEGGGTFRPPCYLPNYWTVNLITAFDSSGLELSEYVAKVYLKVTDDVTGRVKGQIFLLSPPASLGKATVSNWNKADEKALIVSGILLSALLSLLWPCVKSMSSKVKRLKEVKFEILDLGNVKHVFRLNFRQIRKKLESFVLPQIGSNLKDGKCRNPLKSVKVTFLGPQNGKIQTFFQDANLKFCSHIHR